MRNSKSETTVASKVKYTDYDEAVKKSDESYDSDVPKRESDKKKSDAVVAGSLDVKGNTKQYIGIALLMLAFVLAATVSSITGGDYIVENFLMTFVMAIIVIFVTLGYLTITIVAGSVTIVSFVVYKVYTVVVAKGQLHPVSLLWAVLPIMATFGIQIFVNSNMHLAIENALLKKQVGELVMMDPVTGLYNLRSMYMDIQTQISYSERNDIPFSLMIIRLRYPKEMKRVLKLSEYEKAVKQLSLLLVDTVRLEDKVYSIDDNGGFGIILTCDKEGTKIVEKRLRGKLEDPKWFAGVSAKHQIRTEVRIGYLQYDKSKFNRNASSFKDSVEEEVDYDV